MGLYINPPDKSKEEWLVENGRQIDEFDFVIHPFGNGNIPVCLVDNGPFTAAGVAYNEVELKAFSDPRDTRRKVFFSVPIEKLVEVVPSLTNYLKS